MSYYEGSHYIVTGIGTNGFIVSGYPISESTEQRVSTIVTPNGRTSTFDEHGVISTGTVLNIIDENLRKTYLEMYGGK